MKKKIINVLIFSILALMLLSACGKDKDNSSTYHDDSNAVSSEISPEDTTINDSRTEEEKKTDKKNTEGEIVTDKDSQNNTSSDGFAGTSSKADSRENNKTENNKKEDEKTSSEKPIEPEERDIEGELIPPAAGIELPIVPV